MQGKIDMWDIQMNDATLRKNDIQKEIEVTKDSKSSKQNSNLPNFPA